MDETQFAKFLIAMLILGENDLQLKNIFLTSEKENIPLALDVDLMMSGINNTLVRLSDKNFDLPWSDFKNPLDPQAPTAYWLDRIKRWKKTTDNIFQFSKLSAQEFEKIATDLATKINEYASFYPLNNLLLGFIRLDTNELDDKTIGLIEAHLNLIKNYLSLRTNAISMKKDFKAREQPLPIYSLQLAKLHTLITEAATPLSPLPTMAVSPTFTSSLIKTFNLFESKSEKNLQDDFMSTLLSNASWKEKIKKLTSIQQEFNYLEKKQGNVPLQKRTQTILAIYEIIINLQQKKLLNTVSLEQYQSPEFKA